jgi:hypothetical protein
MLLSTKITKWGKQAFRRKAKARKDTNEFGRFIFLYFSCVSWTVGLSVI